MCSGCTSAGMKLADWMSQKSFDDDEVAALLGTDRATVSRIRREVNKPSWPLAAKIKAATDGSVTADDFLPEIPELEAEARA